MAATSSESEGSRTPYVAVGLFILGILSFVIGIGPFRPIGTWFTNVQPMFLQPNGSISIIGLVGSVTGIGIAEIIVLLGMSSLRRVKVLERETLSPAILQYILSETHRLTRMGQNQSQIKEHLTRALPFFLRKETEQNTEQINPAGAETFAPAEVVVQPVQPVRRAELATTSSRQVIRNLEAELSARRTSLSESQTQFMRLSSTYEDLNGKRMSGESSPELEGQVRAMFIRLTDARRTLDAERADILRLEGRVLEMSSGNGTDALGGAIMERIEESVRGMSPTVNLKVKLNFANDINVGKGITGHPEGAVLFTNEPTDVPLDVPAAATIPQAPLPEPHQIAPTSRSSHTALVEIDPSQGMPENMVPSSDHLPPSEVVPDEVLEKVRLLAEAKMNDPGNGNGSGKRARAAPPGV